MGTPGSSNNAAPHCFECDEKGCTLLKKYRDTPMSLADACVVRMTGRVAAFMSGSPGRAWPRVRRNWMCFAKFTEIAMAAAAGLQ